VLTPGPSGHRCKTPSLAVFLSRYSVVKEQGIESELHHAIRKINAKSTLPHRGRRTLV